MKVILSARLKGYILFTGLVLSFLGVCLIYDRYAEVPRSSSVLVNSADSLVKPVAIPQVQEDLQKQIDSLGQGDSQEQNIISDIINGIASICSDSTKTAKSIAAAIPYVFIPEEFPTIEPLFKATPYEPLIDTTIDFLPLLNNVPMRQGSFVGIVNRGNTCYAASALQMLFRIPLIRIIIANMDVYYPIIKAEAASLQSKAENIFAVEKTQQSVRSLELKRQDLINMVKIIEGVNHIFSQLQGNEKGAANFDFKKSMQCLPGHYGDNDQEDADEYLSMIMAAICEFVPLNQQHHLKVFVSLIGNVKSVGLEPKQSKLNHKIESEFRLSLPVNKSTETLKEMMDSYFATENKIEQWYDEEAKIPGILDQSRKLSALPEIFPIHLKRLQFCQKKKIMTKLGQPIYIPEILDLSPFLEEASKEAKYVLKMFIQHRGGAHSGHYIAYSREPTGNWYSLDDTSVKDDFDRRSSNIMPQSYIYFYEKIKAGELEKYLSNLTVERALLTDDGHKGKEKVVGGPEQISATTPSKEPAKVPSKEVKVPKQKTAEPQNSTVINTQKTTVAEPLKKKISEPLKSNAAEPKNNAAEPQNSKSTKPQKSKVNVTKPQKRKAAKTLKTAVTETQKKSVTEPQKTKKSNPDVKDKRTKKTELNVTTAEVIKLATGTFGTVKKIVPLNSEKNLSQKDVNEDQPTVR